jgi:transcriptional regulator with XRE-family HTH domain
MAETKWTERSIEEVIRDDPQLADDLRLALSSAEEAATFIRQLRSNAGLTQHELARRLGISQPRVSAIERGIGSDGPTYGILRRIARACGVDWSLERGLAESSVRGEHASVNTLVAGAFGFIAGAVGMALLQMNRPNEGVATTAVDSSSKLEPAAEPAADDEEVKLVAAEGSAYASI